MYQSVQSINMDQRAVVMLTYISEAEFHKLFDNIVEHVPQVAAELFRRNPFENSQQLLQILEYVIDSRSTEEKV